MEIRIRNVLGLEDVRLPLPARLTLVAGMNGAGKTSLLQSIAAAAMGDWKMRGVRLKGEAAHLVRKGAAQGSVLLDYGAGSVRITYPDGKVERQGQPREFGTALGIGAERFMSLPAEQRRREVAARFRTEPTREDFESWWRTHEAAGLMPDAPTDDPRRQAVDVLWDDIQVSGWDAIAKRTESACKGLQGQWREATGVGWGDKLRLTWAPNGLYRDEEYPLAPAQDALAAARDALEQLLRKEAVTAEARAQAEAQAAELPGLETRRAEQDAEVARLNAEIDAILDELDKHPEPVDPRSYPTCPHCFATVQIIRSPSAGITLQKPPRKAMSLEVFDGEVKLRAALATKLQNQRQAKGQAERDMIVLAERVRVATEAQARVDRYATLPEQDADAIVAARRAVEQAEERVKAIKQLQRAIQINAEYEKGRAILDGLLPSGVRATVLERKISEINAALAKLAREGAMHEVGLTLDCDLTYDGRAYAMLSESEQWRCDLVMMLLMAQRERAQVVLVDRVDLLHPQAREGVYRLLAGAGMAVIATQTARAPDPRYVPDLDAHKLGHACWLGGGKLVEA